MNALGPILEDNQGNKYNTEEILSDKKYVLILFSEYYCPGCKPVSYMLKKIYEETRDDIEIVWVPSDDKERFDLYFPTLPWKCIPLSSPMRFRIHKRLGVQGIPFLALTRTDGTLLNNKVKDILWKSDEMTWVEHFESVAHYDWQRVLFGNEEWVPELKEKEFLFGVFISPMIQHFQVLVAALNRMYSEGWCSLIYVPENKIKHIQKCTDALDGFSMQSTNQRIPHCVKQFDVQRMGIPQIVPIEVSTSCVKKNISDILVRSSKMNVRKLCQKLPSMTCLRKLW